MDKLMNPWLAHTAVTGIEARTPSGIFGSCQREKCCTLWGLWLCCTTETKICSDTTWGTQKIYSGELTRLIWRMVFSTCQALTLLTPPPRLCWYPPDKTPLHGLQNQWFLAFLLAYHLNTTNKPKLQLFLKMTIDKILQFSFEGYAFCYACN
jgi:hypothetical protein